jgi:methyl-accepting chemotaxis protein
MSIRAKLLASFMALVMATIFVGGFAWMKNREMGDLAATIYDKTFTGISYAGQAQSAFLHFAASREMAGAASGDQAAAKYLKLSCDKLEITGERAATDKAREMAKAVHDQVAALGALSIEDQRQRLPEIDRDLTRLVGRYAADALVYRAEADTIAAESQRALIVSVIATILVTLAAALFIANRLTKPIVSLTTAISRLASGDADIEMAPQRRRDEIGQMWRAVIALRETVGIAFARGQMLEHMPVNIMVADPKTFEITYVNRAVMGLLKQIEEHLPIKAEDVLGSSIDCFHRSPAHQRALLGDPSKLPWTTKIRLGKDWFDLQVSAIHDRRGEYCGAMLNWLVTTDKIKLTSEFETGVTNNIQEMKSVSGSLKVTADALATTADDTRYKADALASAARNTTTNVNIVATAASQLTVSNGEIGRHVHEADQIAGNAVQVARQTDATVHSLSAGADRIGSVVKLISEIASQTNLLALNATIEAARAGEAGNGFAVVAGEVKALADQTARATKEIGEQIKAIRGAATDSVEAIRQIGEIIETVSGITTAIAAAVTEQSAATFKIEQSVAEVQHGTEEVFAITRGVAESAAATGSAAESLRDAVASMATQSASIDSSLNTFLVAIRAA